MSAIDCPCGQDCFADIDDTPENRRFAGETLHWQMAALRRVGVELGSVAGDEMVRGLDVVAKGMATARNRYDPRQKVRLNTLGKKVGQAGNRLHKSSPAAQEGDCFAVYVLRAVHGIDARPV